MQLISIISNNSNTYSALLNLPRQNSATKYGLFPIDEIQGGGAFRRQRFNERKRPSFREIFELLLINKRFACKSFYRATMLFSINI